MFLGRGEVVVYENRCELRDLRCIKEVLCEGYFWHF
jgi:hypothetical protein